ncbi:MAG: Crp/Fnr family transcriptional regulator, partial [Hyphomicrobiales bacterium]|nr:Crp/Fnr family transcriptional regulator [Hyphomicrobiales bacterium]
MATTLAKLPWFADARDLDLSKFERRVNWKRYDEGEVVVDFEDSSDDVYFIASGDLRVLIRTAAGKEIILAEPKGGEFFGELAAIDEIPRSANVTALTRAELCIVPAATFRELVFASPILGRKLMRLLTTRVRELNQRLAEHTLLDVRHRLYSELLRLSKKRAGHGDKPVVSPPPYHHVLAARIGCRREQVTRELSALVHEGLVTKAKGAMVI